MVSDIILSNSNAIEGSITNTIVGSLNIIGDETDYTFSINSNSIFGINSNTLIVLDGTLLDRDKAISNQISINVVKNSAIIFTKSFTINTIIDPESSIITYIDPISSHEKETQVLKIKGTNFTLGGTPIIKINDTTITQLVTTNTQIACLIPALDAGIYNINITNGLGK